jgi:hypothetical protein
MSWTLADIVRGESFARPQRTPTPTTPRDEARVRCTTGKTVFIRKQDARTAAAVINHTQRTPMKAFRCGYCDGWHLGHHRGAIT